MPKANSITEAAKIDIEKQAATAAPINQIYIMTQDQVFEIMAAALAETVLKNKPTILHIAKQRKSGGAYMVKYHE